jgi:hypothetical protein
MDADTQKDNSPDAIRERIEQKRDEFAGGPEAGWQEMEATVVETRSSATQTPEGSTGGTPSAMSGSIATAAGSSVATGGKAGATASIPEEDLPPFDDEHPIGVGEQCFNCGAYNQPEAQTCWNCSSDLTHAAAQTPGVVESVLPAEDETLPNIGSPTGTSTDTAEGARPVSGDID